MTKQADFLTFDKVASEVSKESGFELRSPFAERHGSWEIVFRKAGSSSFHRFVQVALSEQYDGHWFLELYIVAEDDQYAQRELNASFAIEPSDFAGWANRAAYREALTEAFRAASHLVPAKQRRDLAFIRPVVSAAAGNPA